MNFIYLLLIIAAFTTISCKTTASSSSSANSQAQNPIYSQGDVPIKRSPIKKGHIRLLGQFLKPIPIPTSSGDNRNKTDSQTWSFLVNKVIGKGSTYTGFNPTENNHIYIIIQPGQYKKLKINPDEQVIIEAFHFDSKTGTTPSFIFYRQLSTTNN